MDINFLKMLGIQGDQQNPAVLNQMANQASPTQSQWRAPMLPQAPQTSPWTQMSQPAQPQEDQHQIIPVESPDPMPSAQPSSVPLGSTAQELKPAQPNFMESSPWLNAQAMIMAHPVSADLKKLFGETDALSAKSMADQDKALDEQKRLAEEYRNKEDRFDYRPLAAYVDSMTGSKFGGTAEQLAPESPEQKMLKQLEFAKSISAGSQALTKDQLDYLKNKIQQQSFMENRLSKQDIAKLNNATKLATSSATAGMAGKRMDMMGQRLEQQVGKEARGTVNNDAILKQFAPRLEGAAKIGELIHAAQNGKVVSNQALLGQVNAEIARLETGSQSPGLHASEKTELLDKAAELHAYLDSITGKPEDSVRPEVLQAGTKLVDELSSSYMKGVDSRFKMLAAGMTPAQQKIAKEKHDSLKATYAPRFGGWKGLGPEAGDVEDGHVFMGGSAADPKNWKAQ